MEVIVSDKSNFVEIWLTRADQEDPQCMDTLPKMVEDIVRQKRYPIIFRSGREEMYDVTLSLLQHNRICSASQVEEQKT